MIIFDVTVGKQTTATACSQWKIVRSVYESKKILKKENLCNFKLLQIILNIVYGLNAMT